MKVARDIGCSGFKRAAENRKMVANKEFVVGYLEIERIVQATPQNKPLPAWIPTGGIPVVGKKDLQRNHDEFVDFLPFEPISPVVLEEGVCPSSIGRKKGLDRL